MSAPLPVTVEIIDGRNIRVTIPLADYELAAGDPATCRPGVFVDTVTAAEAREWAGDQDDPIADALREAADHVEQHVSGGAR